MVAAGMSTAWETLVGYLDDDRPFARTRAELEPLWLAAANERLQQQRARIPVLGRLADERGVDAIRTFADLVPLLFAHSNYKSYPDAFLTKHRWDLMNRWLDTLSAVRVEGVDVEGVEDQDEWIERLQRYYETIGMLFSPDLIVVGGGVSRDSDKFLPKLRLRAPIVPAELRNKAGIIGAAHRAVDLAS